MSIVYDPWAVAKELEQKEDFSSIPYLDSSGTPTIGIGTTKYLPQNIPVTMSDPPITYEEAVNQLTLYCKNIIAVIDRVIIIQINQNQTTAVILFCYNVGENNFATSTLCRVINENGTPHELHQAFMLWDKETNKETGELEISTGLVNRREFEYQLYIS